MTEGEKITIDGCDRSLFTFLNCLPLSNDAYRSLYCYHRQWAVFLCFHKCGKLESGSRTCERSIELASTSFSVAIKILRLYTLGLLYEKVRYQRVTRKILLIFFKYVISTNFIVHLLHVHRVLLNTFIYQNYLTVTWDNVIRLWRTIFDFFKTN